MTQESQNDLLKIITSTWTVKKISESQKITNYFRHELQELLSIFLRKRRHEHKFRIIASQDLQRDVNIHKHLHHQKQQPATVGTKNN